MDYLFRCHDPQLFTIIIIIIIIINIIIIIHRQGPARPRPVTRLLAYFHNPE